MFIYRNEKNSLIESILKFKSYSQYYEDLILYLAFFGIKKGFYIDIGANDPEIISVTKAFYLNGWNGINIEPLPDKFNSLVKMRPKDINLNIGVGKEIGYSNLYVNEGMSTLQKKFSKNKAQTINNFNHIFDYIIS